jgi:hypothetical protein
MNSTAVSLLANSNAGIDENQEMEVTIGSVSIFIGPSGSTRLSDLEIRRQESPKQKS